MKPRSIFRLSTLSLSVMMAVAQANPTGGEIQSGDITINPSDANGSMVIDQRSQQGVINWNSFNINPNESVQINMANSSGVQLDRVTGVDPSKIMGNLSSNGQVFLINPNGVVFGKDSQLDTAALVVSTLNISDPDFLAAHYDFNQNANPNGRAGSIVNNGNLQNSNLIALLAPQVSNNGVINAEVGEVLVGSGSHVSLNLGNNPILGYEVDEPIAVMNEAGTPVSINNTGSIQGHQVFLSATEAHHVLNQVVSNSG